MLTSRLSLALGLSASLAAIAAAHGEQRNADAENLVNEFVAQGGAPQSADKDAPAKPPADAPYSHIYQAPLFGTLFAVSSSEAAVDESALRYYASLHNFARANAEIKRLKALHPNWTPPTNIYSTAGAGADEQPFWDLLAADRIEELNAGITLKQRSTPGWKPSRDLTTKIARKVGIEALVKQSDAKKPEEVLKIVDNDPSILHCAYMDANWRVADAFLDVGLPKRAFEIYHAVIATCPDHDERLATVRKAISRFSFEQTRSLIAMGAKSADGATEFDAAKIDLTRAIIAALNQGKTSEKIEPEALNDFLAEVTRTHERSDVALAGWFEYNRNHFDAAAKWFALADLGSPALADPTAINLAEGRALSMMKLGRFDDAVAVAYAWRNVSKTMRETYINASASLLTRINPLPQLPEKMLADFTAFVQADKNVSGAEAIAWYRFNHEEWDDAGQWFKTALNWKGVDPAAGPGKQALEADTATAIEGYARALARGGRLDEATAIADRWRLASDALQAVFVNLMNAAVQAAPLATALNTDQLSHFSDIAETQEAVDSANSLGWLDYRTADYATAISWFRKSIAWAKQGRGDVNANQGLALALKQSGQLAEAEEIAWAFAKDSPDMRAIYVSSVVAELASDKATLTGTRLNRFVTLVMTDRSASGAQALGWYRIKEGNCSYAAPWFRKAAAWTASSADDSQTARGLTLSLKAVGAFAQAEDLAYAWRERDAALRALYLDIGVQELTSEAPVIPMSEARVSRFSQMALSERHIGAARALGWWRYQQGGNGYGGQWLRLAADWNDADKRDEKTDEGLSLVLRETGRLAQASALVLPWAESSPLMKKLYVDVMVERLGRDNPPYPVDEARIKEFVDVIEPMKSPLGAQALGWFRYQRGEYDQAGVWFKNALDWWPAQRLNATKRLKAPPEEYQPILAKLALAPEDYRRTPRAYPNTSMTVGKTTELYVNTDEGLARTQEGYVLTLRQLGRGPEAEAIAWAWRDRWPNLRRVFVDIAADALVAKDGANISPERMRRYASAIDDMRAPGAAAAMAYRLLQSKSNDAAVEWYAKALSWTQADPPDPGLVEGYVAALQADKKFAEADALASRWRGKSARFDLIYLQSQLQALRASGKTDPETLAKFAGIEKEIVESKSGEGALSLGWIAYETKDYEKALIWFRDAIEWGGKDVAPKAKEGVALSLRAEDKFQELAEFGYAERDVSPAIREDYYGGMIAWLTSDKPREVPPQIRAHFEEVVLADHSALGAQALGWSEALRQQWPASRRWFESAVAWAGFDPLSPPTKVDADKAKIVEGYVQALRGAGDVQKAENVAYAWRDANPALAGLYLQIFTQAVSEDSVALAPERVSRFADFAQSQHSADAAGALGWRFYRAKDSAQAIVWFERALAWSPNGTPPAKVGQGYALALRAAGRLEDAENFAWSYVRDDADLRALYISAVVAQLGDEHAVVTKPRVDRFIDLVVATRSSSGAQALGWRRLKEDNCVYAAPWFRRAAAWGADASEDANIARGLALSLQKAGAYRQAEDLAYAWRERSPDMGKLFIDASVQELTSEAPALRMSEPRMRRFSERVLAEHNVEGARAIGWSRYGDAVNGYGGEWFRRAVAWNESDKRDAKTDEGFALTERAVGRLAEAEALAHPWAGDDPLMKKLYVDVFVEELSRDNPPEPIDEARVKDFVTTITAMRSALGAQALGWYRLERGENDESARWFKQALDWWPQQRLDRSKRLAAPPADYAPILAKLALDPKDYHRTPRAFPNTSFQVGKTTDDYVSTEEGLAKTQEGYAQALRAVGRTEDAEAIAYAWRDRWPSLRALYLDMAAVALDRRDGPALAPERLKKFVAAIEADHSVTGAAAMAWRQYRLNAFENASDWFQKAISWSNGSTPSPNIVEGYVLALQAAKKFDMAAAVAAKWRNASPELNLVYVQSELQRLRAAGKPAQLGTAQFAEIEKTLNGAQSAEGAMSLAWVAYEAHDYAHALLWFRKAEQWGADDSGSKAKEGVALSLRGLGRFEELAEFGYAERKTSDVIHDTYFGGMVAWLTSDKPLLAVNADARAHFEDAVAEERSALGGQALAWGALLRGDWGQSRKWFETALDWSGVDVLAPQGPADADRAKMIEGYVQALRSGGDLGRAEDVAYIWRDASNVVGGLYLEIFTQELSTDRSQISEERVSRFGAMAETKKSPQAAGALGWRFYRAKSYPDAIAWFEKAIGWTPGRKGDAKIDEGYALSLRAAGRLVEAEDFAWDHRAESRELRAAYVAAFSDQLLNPSLSPRLSAPRLARFSEIVVADKLSTGAAALGWRRLQDGNCGYSLGWFRDAIAWSDQGKGDDKIYSGYAQGLRAAGMFNEAEDAAFTYAERSPEARTLYTNIVIEELTRQWPRVPMSEPRMDRFADVVTKDHSSSGAQAIGWRRYMQAGNGYAVKWFALAANWSTDKRGDAHLNEGWALSVRAVGRLVQAEGIAYPWIGRAPAVKKLFIDVAVEELSRDNPPEPIPEARVNTFESVFNSSRSPVGAQALGWYRLARGENEAAARWFQNALDWWPQRKDDADQKLSVPPDDYKPIMARLAMRMEDYRRTPLAFRNSSLLIGKDTESYVDTDVGFAKTVEGYVRALAALSRFDQAETLGLRWLDRWPPMRDLMVDLASTELTGPNAEQIPQERLARLAKLIEDSRTPAGADALGWHAYKAKDYANAARWFKNEIDWRGPDGKLSLDVARAYADALRNLKQYDAALQFVTTMQARMPDLAGVAVDIGLDSLTALDPASQAADDRIRQIASGVSEAHAAGGAMSLGWLALGRKEYQGAEAWFRKAIEWAPAGGDPDPKALEGFARTLQGENRFDDFMRFTNEWSAHVASLKPMFIEASAQAFAQAAANGQDVPTETLAHAGKAFAEARSSNGAQALAWQRISQKDWTAAAAWFQAARDWSKDPDADLKTIEGYVIALRNLHRDDEAEALAFNAGQHDDSMRNLYLETVADRLTRSPPAPPNEAGMKRFADAVLNAKSGNGAQALGWYSFNARQYPAAIAWFEKSLAFEPTENAALGAAFTYRKLNDTDNFDRIVSTYRGAYAKVGELTAPRNAPRERRAAAEDGPAAPARRFRATITETRRRSPSADSYSSSSGSTRSSGGGGGGGQPLGWKLLNEGRPVESARAFESAMQTSSGSQRRDFAYGRSLALLSAGDNVEAGRVAGSVDLNASQRKDIGTQLLASRAWEAYKAGHYQTALRLVDQRRVYADETRDLMLLRVLSLRKLNRMDDAAKVQGQLDDQIMQ